MPQAPGPTRPMPTVDEDGATGRVLTGDDTFFDEPAKEDQAVEILPSGPAVTIGGNTIPPGASSVGAEAVSFASLEDPDSVADETVPATAALRGGVAGAVGENPEEVKIFDLLSRCSAMFRRFNPVARRKLAKMIRENPEAGMVEINLMDVLIRCDQDTESAEPLRGHGMYIFNLGESGGITLHALNPREDGDGLLATIFRKGDAEVIGEAACFELPVTSTVKYMGKDTVHTLFIPASLIKALPLDAQAELLARGLEQRSFLSDLNTDMAMASATTETEPYTIPANSHPKEVLDWLLKVGTEGREVRRYRSGEEIELIPGAVAYLKKGCVDVVENQTEGLGDNIVVAKVMEGNLLGEKVAVAKMGATGGEATATLIANTDSEIAYIPIPQPKRADANYEVVLHTRIAALRALHISMSAKLQRAAAHRNSLEQKAARAARKP